MNSVTILRDFVHILLELGLCNPCFMCFQNGSLTNTHVPYRFTPWNFAFLSVKYYVQINANKDSVSV